MQVETGTVGLGKVLGKVGIVTEYSSMHLVGM